MILYYLAITITLLTSPVFAYVGSQSCIKCHKQAYEQWHSSHHAKTLSFNSSHFLPEKLEDLQFKNKEARFKTMKEGDSYYLYEFLNDGEKFNKVKFNFVIGSGTRGKSFVNYERGQLKLLPFNILGDHWGFEDSDSMPSNVTTKKMMTLDKQCLQCHALTSQVEPLIENKYQGISCESCHSQAEEHIKMPSKNNISIEYHPPEKFGVCTSCHTANEKSIELIHANQTYLLEKSRCYQDNKKMNCMTCHQAHSLKIKANSCIQCHKGSKEHYQQKLEKCIDCHMPKSKIGMELQKLDGSTYEPLVRDHRIKK